MLKGMCKKLGNEIIIQVAWKQLEIINCHHNVSESPNVHGSFKDFSETKSKTTKR